MGMNIFRLTQLFLAPSFILALCGSATAVDTVFTIDEQQSSLTIEASTVFIVPFSDTDTQMLGGTIDTTLDFGTAGGFPAMADFTVTGAEVSPLSPFLFTLGSPPTFGVNVSVNDAVADVTTPNPPATLTMLATSAIQYEFDASEFDITLNQGTVVSTGAVNQTINLADSPVIGNASPGTLGTITLTPTGMAGALTMIDALLELPIQFIEDVDVDGQIVTLDVDGTVFAISSFMVNLSPSADVNNDGTIDGSDFVQIQRDDSSLIPQWQSDYGTAGSQAATQPIPEPAGALLLLVGMCCGVARRRIIYRGCK
ncbi:MAG: hypothetical protein RH917_18015 [Lacipirellulaceae bacterium]